MHQRDSKVLKESKIVEQIKLSMRSSAFKLTHFLQNFHCQIGCLVNCRCDSSCSRVCLTEMKRTLAYWILCNVRTLRYFITQIQLVLIPNLLDIDSKQLRIFFQKMPSGKNRIYRFLLVYATLNSSSLLIFRELSH